MDNKADAVDRLLMGYSESLKLGKLQGGWGSHEPMENLLWLQCSLPYLIRLYKEK